MGLSLGKGIKMIKISERVQLQQHISKRAQGIKYIVIHDTANTAPYAGAVTHKKYFLTTSRKASADFVVDDQRIIQLNDYRYYATWHCGDGKGRYGITNQNSIGIEMCIDSTGDIGVTTNNTLLLTLHLMQELSVPIDRVVRHYDASHKICPSHMQADNWRKWWTFKDNLKRMTESKAYQAPEKKPEVTILMQSGDAQRRFTVDAQNVAGHWVAGVREILEGMGYSVSWDGKQIIAKG